MDFSFTLRPLFFVLILLSTAAFCCKSESLTTEGGEEDPTEGGEEDPTQIVAKALLCFNDKFIYSSCEETYRLTQSGNINVPPEFTDEYCNGPCLTETHLVLNCIEEVLSNFLFYNKATIHDIRATLSAGCGYTSERGNFNVAEHIKSSYAHKVIKNYSYTYMYLLIFLGCYFL